MKRSHLTTLALSGLATIALMGAAHAGGFSRGTADTDTLFESENFNIRFDERVVFPNQKFSVNANPALVGTNFYGTYTIPSVAVKFNVSDNLRCEGTYTQSFGGDTEYESPKLPSGALSEVFHTDEFGAACAVRFTMGTGVLSVIGGGFVEQLNYERVTDLSIPTGGALPPGSLAVLKLKGEEYGYRAGLAYEIPDIKARFSIMYRSETDYGAPGTLTVPAPLVGGPPGATVALPAQGSGNLPQSLEFAARSGVAPGWLVFASAKWTDWSVLKNLTVVTPTSTIVDQYNWKDGWTITGGVVHQFSDMFAGQVSLTWDQGVSTGWDLRGDTWTLGLGGRLRGGTVPGEFRFGAGFSYLDGVAETQYANAVIPGNIHSGFNRATDAGYAVTLSAGYIVQW